MNDNTAKYIQLQTKSQFTNSLIYKGEKYPINFDIFKHLSKYFYEIRYEISENDEIDLTKYDPEDNITHFSTEEVLQFIKYIQFEPIELTEENVAILHYFGHIYGIEQLTNSTEEYIAQHFSEVILKFLMRKELHGHIDDGYYEDHIANNFSEYVNNNDLYELDISTLYRILEKVTSNKAKSINKKILKIFLMKILAKKGGQASILFKYFDINTFDDETLTYLLSQYSDSFEFEFINGSVLKLYLDLKKKYEKEHQEHQNQQNSLIEKYENELKKEKMDKEEMQKKYEEERQMHLNQLKEFNIKCSEHEEYIQIFKSQYKEMQNFYEEERQEYTKKSDSFKNMYENELKERLKLERDLQDEKIQNKEKTKFYEKELQEHRNQQKTLNDTYEKELEIEKATKVKHDNEIIKYKYENERLKMKQEELYKELDKLKNQQFENSGQINTLDTEFKLNKERYISISKYNEHMILNQYENSTKLHSLIKYLINEQEKQSKIPSSEQNITELISIDRNDGGTEERIFISQDMIDIMHKNGSLNSKELANEIESIPEIYFDLQYPSINFDDIFSEIINLKKNLCKTVKVSILYDGIENTDQRFYNIKEINMVRFGNGVKNIESSGKEGSFCGCSSLMSVLIPSSVTSIGSSAFSGCSLLTSISIPSSVTSIGSYAFFGCSSLINISIPQSVTSIGSYIFYGCSEHRKLSQYPRYNSKLIIYDHI